MGSQEREVSRPGATPRARETLLAALLVALFYGWFAYPLVGTASQDRRLVAAFSVDEGRELDLVRDALRHRSFRLDFRSYPHLYFNVALAILLPIDGIHPLSEQETIVFMRLLSILFTGAGLLVSYLVAYEAFGRLAAWSALALLALAPLEMNAWAVAARPDLPQLFFLVASLFFLGRTVRSRTARAPAAASFCAGLAFATKYTGVYLLPVIWLAAALAYRPPAPGREPATRPARREIPALAFPVAAGCLALICWCFVTPRFAARHFSIDGTIDDPALLARLASLRALLLPAGAALVLIGIVRPGRALWAPGGRLSFTLNRVATSLILFAAAFVLGSPSSLPGFQFVKGIVEQGTTVNFGTWIRESQDPAGWSNAMLSILGGGVAALAGVGLIRAAADLLRGKWDPRVAMRALLALWSVGYAAYLALQVHLLAPRYLLPVVPSLAILAAETLAWLHGQIRSRPPLGSSRGAAVVVAVLLLAISWDGARRLAAWRDAFRHRESGSAVALAGRWIADTYPDSTAFVIDQYVYVPPRFAKVVTVLGGTAADIERWRPDVVVTSDVIASIYRDPSRGKEYRLGEVEYRKRFEFYDGLGDGPLGFHLRKDFGTIRVYENGPGGP